MADLVETWLDPNEEDISKKLFMFRRSWDNMFRDVWTWAHKIDRPETPGRVAKKLGLGYLHQPDAPMFWRAAPPSSNEDSISENTGAPTPPTTSPAEGYVESIPVAAPGESVARSGHAYLSEMGEQLGTKEKVKTRKAPMATDTKEDQEVVEPEDDEDKAWTDLPDVLPAEFRMGKKTMKACTSTTLKD